MSDLEFRRWKTAPVSQLADLCSCLDDMLSVIDFTSRLIELFDQDEPDYTLLDALSTAAIVRYTRCFVQGYRFRLDVEAHLTMDEGESLLHERIRQTRDWHIAHPINLQEIYTLAVGFNPQAGAAAKAEAIAVQARSEIPLEAPDLFTLRRLAERWRDWLEQAVNESRAQLLPEAMKLSAEQLLRLPSTPERPNPNPQARRKQR